MIGFYRWNDRSTDRLRKTRRCPSKTAQLQEILRGHELIRQSEQGLQAHKKSIDKATKGSSGFARKVRGIIFDRKHQASERFGKQLDELTIIEPPLSTTLLYHYVHKSNQDLVPKLTKVLEEMERNGTIEKILDEEVQDLLDYSDSDGYDKTGY